MTGTASWATPPTPTASPSAPSARPPGPGPSSVRSSSTSSRRAIALTRDLMLSWREEDDNQNFQPNCHLFFILCSQWPWEAFYLIIILQFSFLQFLSKKNYFFLRFQFLFFQEQLVEMTGLSGRVIRVWFQNKRCKVKNVTKTFEFPISKSY